MANTYKVSITTLSTANNPTPVITASASTTLVKSVSFSHDDHNTSVTMGITKAAGSRIDLLTKTHTANEMTQLNNDVIALEAGDIITVASDHISASDFGYVTVIYVEDTTALAGQAISVLTDVDTSGVVGGDTLVYNSSSGNWEPVAAGGGAVDSVNGQTGVVVLDMDDINDVNAPTPAANDVLKWTGNPINAWTPVDWLGVMYAEFKQGGSTTVTNGGLTDSSLTLTSASRPRKSPFCRDTQNPSPAS